MSGSVELPLSVAAEDEPTENWQVRKGQLPPNQNAAANAQVQPTHCPLSDFYLPDPVEGDTLLSYWDSVGVKLPACCGDGDEDDDFFALSVESKASPLHLHVSPRPRSGQVALALQT